MKVFITVLCSIFIASHVFAETFSITYENGRVVRRFPEDTQPVIGLALSGGGARGLAQIGVIEALEENGIRIERIAGTSMGSIVGGLYASGYSPAALRDIMINIDWGESFSSSPRRRTVYFGDKETSQWPLLELRFEGFMAKLPTSLSSGQRIISLISWLTLLPTYECEEDFDKLPIPFRSITTDLNTGRKVIRSHGNLGRAIQASATVPLLLTPVEWNGMRLVDGGLKDNLPINDVREMGSDFVIAVAIEESMHPPNELDNILNIADQSTSILMKNVTDRAKIDADFIIIPDMENFSSSNFNNIPDMIEQGRLSALAALPALKDSLARMTSHFRSARITDITVSDRSRKEFATALLPRSLQTGKTVFLADISKGLETLWESGKYCDIHADLDENTGILSIELTEIPDTAVVFVKAQNNDEIIEEKYELSSQKNGHPSIQTVITRVDSLIRIIRSGVYSFAKITDIEIDEISDVLSIRLSAPQVTRIHIDKGLSSRHSMIMREVELNEGDIFDLRKVMRSVENLYGTNLFELVYIDVESYNGGVGIRIHLKEKKWTVARFGLRFDETFNTEGRVILSRENILGFGNMLSFTAQTGQRTKLLVLENRNNRIYKSLYSYSLKAYRQFWKRQDFLKHSNFLNYEDRRIGTVISVGQQMDKLGNVMVQFKSETVKIRFSPSTQMKNENKELRSIVFRSQIDSYDRYPFPKKGFMNIIYIESASEVLGGTEQFAKIYWRSSFAKSQRKNTLAGTFSLGTADPSLPGIEAFTLGGDASRLNCYDLDSAGSHFYADFLGLSDEEKRGTRLAVGKLSYRRFIPKAFYIDFIYSIGNVWEKDSVINTRSLIQSYGIMGSLTTYAGPLSFGWGVTSEGNERFYMSAGWDF